MFVLATMGQDPDREFKNFKDAELDELEAKIKAERMHRGAEREIKWPIETDEFRLGTSKSDNDHEATELGLPDRCANGFRYAGLEIFFRVKIFENGTVAATHIREPKSKAWIEFGRAVEMNCA